MDTSSKITIKTWVQDAFLKELLAHDLWTLAAFGMLKDGDILDPFDPRIDLIRYLIFKKIQESPAKYDDKEWKYSYSLKEFLPLVKEAVKTIRERRAFENSSGLAFSR